jgi:hypothetical protein
MDKTPLTDAVAEVDEMYQNVGEKRAWFKNGRFGVTVSTGRAGSLWEAAGEGPD